MAVDVTKWATEAMDAAGISDAVQREQLSKLFGNEKFVTHWNSTIASVDDVKREQGRTQAEKNRAEAAEKSKQDYYQQELKRAQDNQKVVDNANAQVQRYVDLYGELPGGGDPANPAARRQATQDVIDKKTFDERLGATETNTLGLVTTALKLFDQHRRDFPNEPFDVDNIVKVATEKKLTATQAYAEIMQPKRDAATKAAEEARVKAAVDAALTEERSKRGAAQINDAHPKSEFMTNLKNQQQPTTAQESFIKGWREPEPAKASKQEFGRV